MNNEIILFDWDDTLFSKTEYKKNLRSNLARICGVSEMDIFEYEEQYFNTLIKSDDFKIDDFVNSFEKRFNRKIDLEDFSTDRLGIYSQALFPETVKVLRTVKKRYSLGIYSQGFESLQRIKIENSGINSFFDPNLFFIDRDKTRLDFVNGIPINAKIIDDKREVIEKLKQLRHDLNLTWVNRSNNEVVEGVTTIRNLSGLI